MSDDPQFEDMVGTPIYIGAKALYATKQGEINVGEVVKLFPKEPGRRYISVTLKPYDDSRAYNLKKVSWAGHTKRRPKFRILIIHDSLYDEIELSLLQNELI